MNKYTEEAIKSIIGNARTEKQIEKALTNIPHTRDIDSDYYNIYIPKRENQCIRVFISYRKEVVIQKLVSVTFEYSGIPVFFG